MHEVNTGATGLNPGGWLLARARQRRAPGSSVASGSSPAPTKRMLVAARLIVIFIVLVVVATVLGTGFGYYLARQSDEQLMVQQHAALRNAISEFRAHFVRPGEIDPRLMRTAEQIVGVRSIKFEVDPIANNRETQPVMTADGRIAGFLTWEKPRPMVQAMDRWMPLAAAIVLLLLSFATVPLWQLRRAQRELALREMQAARAADEDKLTGLPNHAKTLEYLDLALAEREDHDWTTFALIELDGMVDVAAQQGVLGSDDLIVAVARRLREALPAFAMCGRVASDQFALALTAGPDVDAEAIIRSALESISRPHWIDTMVRVTAHAGFAQAPCHANTRGELTRRADLALRAAAKRGPGAIVMFDLSIDTVSTDQKFIHRELPRALSANELELYYQPIVASHGGRMVGVEALLRWNHATRGEIQPAAFISIAEQMGLMDTIGAFVLRRALQEAKRWPDDLYVAVNLSPLQVRDNTIVDVVRAALAESGVAPSRLVLEITEGVLIDNPDEMVKRIKDLHGLGVRVALDDFGSGYSNLGYLQRFPLDKLKIDKSFVAALGRSANGGVIIQAIVALGRALGLSVLVEGVETEHQRVLLRLAGCDEMQGFLFAKPAPAKAIDKLLTQAKQGGKPLASGEALTA
ncbi:MAG TPA: bifunctional diguanylate cyclase/phosphodiesterase [Pseudolabrys sp.]|nr:bifunctional diguanylate cyclase/phosphodiesterase [Pseudolabrys sp.]